MDNVNYIRLEPVQAPEYEPITLDEAKTHLRVDSEYEDAYISSLLTVARDEAESYTRRRFGDQIVDVYYEHFKPLRLLGCGVVQDVEIYFRGEQGDWTLIEPEKYELVRAVPAFIEYHRDFSEPIHKDWYEMVKVSVSCGEPMPATVKQWCLLRIGTLYENRVADADRPAKPQPFALELLNTHKIFDY